MVNAYPAHGEARVALLSACGEHGQPLLKLLLPVHLDDLGHNDQGPRASVQRVEAVQEGNGL